jgi:S-DNA-T family DNA segregation ATPase FtsK/SpoIIIE
MIATLRLPATLRRLHLPTRITGRIPGVGADTWTPLDPAEAIRPLSLWDSIYLGRDLYGDPVHLSLAWRMLIAGGLPDAGKSNGVNQILAHAALCPDVGLWLFDGKENELTTWTPLADRVVGHDMEAALDAVADLQRILDGRLAELAAAGVEKVTPESGHGFVLVVVDELALYTSVYGEPAQQKRFSAGLRDLVARGRAAGLVVVAATQRPSSDIVPTSLRDLFAYRWALACANDASSDVILGDGYATAGYSAATIDLDGHAGVGYLLAENRRTPRLFRAAYLARDDIRYLVSVGLTVRGRPALQPLTGGAS